MNEQSAFPYRYGSIRRQMERLSSEHQRRLHQTWIDRVLKILEHDNLVTQAAAMLKSDRGLIFECNFAPMVWDDPRITFRIKQLAASDVTVELIEHEHEVAGRSFKRAQIRVAF